jgi:hypothetical protein
MPYNNYSFEQNKCRWCWMKRERPELYNKLKFKGVKRK